MCVFKTIFKLVAPVPKVENFQNYLFVGPHPDDIEIGAGSTIAKLTSMGKKVTFLICTDGRYGTDDKNQKPNDLIKVRQNEALQSAKILGVSNVIFLPFVDGGFYKVEDLQIEILKTIATIKPDIIFAPDHTLTNECHADHIKVGQAVTYAFITCTNYHLMNDLGISDFAKPQAFAYYYTAKPNTYVKVGKHFKTMLKSIDCYKSQFPIENDTDKIYKSFVLYLKIRALKNGFHKFTAKADAFRAVATLHSHCAPEAEKL